MRLLERARSTEAPAKAVASRKQDPDEALFSVDEAAGDSLGLRVTGSVCG
ncbi:hypothetical protein [Streptosporangium minutum]|nr:hypothetical protein [Streptosporangium minutum]